MLNQHVFLCGFMGAGKSTVGHRLSMELGCRFIDTDQKIVEIAGKPIAKIFADGGEAAFRELEQSVLVDLADQAPSVIALGGGSLVAPFNQELVTRSGTLIYLRAGLNTLADRLRTTAESRPLLAGLSQDGRMDKIRSLLSAREAVYLQADYQIQTEGRTVIEVVKEIVHTLNRSASRTLQ